jgi:hypothetical protein
MTLEFGSLPPGASIWSAFLLLYLLILDVPQLLLKPFKELNCWEAAVSPTITHIFPAFCMAGDAQNSPTIPSRSLSWKRLCVFVHRARGSAKFIPRVGCSIAVGATIRIHISGDKRRG